MAVRPARIVSVVVGIVALAVGALWIGQGSGKLPGSAMSGDRTWLWIGLVVALVGLALLVSGLRRGRSVSRR